MQTPLIDVERIKFQAAGLGDFHIAEGPKGFHIYQGGRDIGQYETRETAEVVGNFCAAIQCLWGIKAARSWAPEPPPMNCRAPRWALRLT